jgi:hypothetical protein
MTPTPACRMAASARAVGAIAARSNIPPLAAKSSTHECGGHSKVDADWLWLGLYRDRAATGPVSIHGGSFIVTSNARHRPPRIQRKRHGVLRMKAALFAAGCAPLLDGGRSLKHGSSETTHVHLQSHSSATPLQ